ncbi:MAG TPA: carboxyl transferase domain-containing protein [Acidimicrobiales bacterium]|nr:carboxyl transferase domain-containing protein [Acidimicrobiales bacterium]
MPFHPSVHEWDADLFAGDPLGFPGYEERRRALRDTGEAVRTGRTEHYAYIDGCFDVLGGSMGAAVGERVVRAYDRARDLRLPVVVSTRTGGARMQEGMVALVQLARTASAAGRHARAGLLSVAVYGSPTTGGVLASYGSLVDVRAATTHAVIGFAGPRVAEGALGITLPSTSHTARSAYEHGLVDEIVTPEAAPLWVEIGLGLADRRLPTRPLPAWEDPPAGGAWGEVLRARAVGRPTGIDRAARLCSSWLELRGTDPVVRAGLATVAGRRCVVVATDRYQGAGRPRPAGFRLAQRAVALAGRLGLPLVTLVDTPGADPSPASEADGLAQEIARTLLAFAECPTPVVSVCVGEGGSGGALALSYADQLLMSEHAVFSVIAPEGAAAILERDLTKAAAVAETLRLTSADMVDLGIVDGVIAEGQAALDVAVAAALDRAVPGQRDARFDRSTARWLVEGE